MERYVVGMRDGPLRTGMCERLNLLRSDGKIAWNEVVASWEVQLGWVGGALLQILALILEIYVHRKLRIDHGTDSQT